MASIGSASSSTSAHTHGSTRSASNSRGNPRPASVARIASLSSSNNSVGVGDEDFFKAFEDTPHLNVSLNSYLIVINSGMNKCTYWLIYVLGGC